MIPISWIWQKGCRDENVNKYKPKLAKYFIKKLLEQDVSMVLNHLFFSLFYSVKARFLVNLPNFSGSFIFVLTAYFHGTCISLKKELIYWWCINECDGPSCLPITKIEQNKLFPWHNLLWSSPQFSGKPCKGEDPGKGKVCFSSTYIWNQDQLSANPVILKSSEQIGAFLKNACCFMQFFPCQCHS